MKEGVKLEWITGKKDLEEFILARMNVRLGGKLT